MGREDRRYAVLEHTRWGQRMAMPGDWTVTDAERAAAGYETVAARQATLDAGNRARAAQAWSERHAPLPPDVQMVRVVPPAAPPAPPSPGAVESGGLAVEADGDVVFVRWAGEAEAADLVGSIQLPLWRRDDGAPGWELAARVRDLDRAVLDLRVLVGRQAGDAAPTEAARATWRGPAAPPAPPRNEVLRGTFTTDELAHPPDGAPRPVALYLPPGATEGLPVVVQADGGGRAYAEVVDAAIDDGRLPPVVLVGVPSGLVVDGENRRGQEYLAGLGHARFAAHERFVTGTVLPWAHDRMGGAPDPPGHVVAGCSNGAAWALTMARRHPDVFGAVLAFSLAGSGRRERPVAGVRHYLVAGTLEEHTREEARRYARAAEDAGCPVHHHERVAGHDFLSWVEEFPAALAWALGG